ncbi:MAG: T9SS type A sorting domain-containing protein [Ignavibacteriae bacterium]|nr:T9SS type A sorting domain-containing protein [Ignavibacteriota bacterium]
MKKLLTLIILLVLMVNYSPAQQKVTFTIAPYRVISAGIVSYMVTETVPAGQVWKVGNFNLRLSYNTNPSGCLTVHADSPVDSALTGLIGGIYTSYTTTAFASPPGISLNLLTLNTSGFLNLPAGTYKLGHLRFNTTAPFLSDTLRFRNPPLSPTTVVYDSTRKCAFGGSATDSSRYTTTNPIITGVEGNISTIPAEFQLYQNYPKYDVPKSSFIKIRIYDVTGKEVANLVNTEMQPGAYEVNWDGTGYASGIYFYKFESKDYTKVLKMVLLK